MACNPVEKTRITKYIVCFKIVLKCVLLSDMDINNLRVLLGGFVLNCREDFHLEKLNIDITGHRYNSMIQQSVDLYLASDWTQCYKVSKLLLDITWEHLNSGHWKNIHITWRHCYTLCTFLKAVCEYTGSIETETSVTNAIKTCDMGLLMGAPFLGSSLSSLAQKLHQLNYMKNNNTNVGSDETCSHIDKKCKTKSELLTISPDCHVTMAHCPPLEHFKSVYMDNCLPVLIDGAMDYWPSMCDRRWSLDYIKNVAGCRTVPIELGSRYTDEAWSQSLMTVRDFISKYIEEPHSEIGYLAQHQLFDQIPELQQDISIPTYCCLGEKDDVDINAWFGPCGTVSPLHNDPKHNLLSQIVGEKYIRLYSDAHQEKLYPHKSRMLANTSEVDVEDPDLDHFPLFKEVPVLECLLRPGQMLYIPPKYWHYVRSLSVSFSVSFWWE